MELVYFAYPSCDADCAHCWSHDMLMGRAVPLETHRLIIDALDIGTYSNIKLSGGEPFINRDLPGILRHMRDKWGSGIPISVFTSGRQILDEDKETLKKNIIDKLGVFDNVSLELSVDEFHVEMLKKRFGWGQSFSDELRIMVSNFIEACLSIKEEYEDSFSMRLKMHCAQGRRDYHVNGLYKWMPKEWWDDYVLITEGLADAGNARKLSGTFKVVESEMMSHFLFPGVSFKDYAEGGNAEAFTDKNGKTCYLVDNSSAATIIRGWWNVIDRVADFYEIHI